ncbi:eukaryotic aspartyl protease domain-containing protein [Ditylenchus destructor]|uniref:Eukaryotic aspartyl protease domain-containing protein n=1 Tax=Ditylenchus destructor TaxID=166010 RepID=A0AAD4R332_9BILA|nr:eukaryotic aspartyl protease domain-containing protein [Ditylenchus destructor]
MQSYIFSLSTTFVQEDKEFECIPGAGGPVGMDNISLGDSAESARMEFGVDVISQNRYFVEVDGIIGLAPECYSVCNITLPLRQILSQYEKQVFTFWSYRPELAYEDRHAYTATNGTAIMSFGDVDRENCLDNWVYVPRHGKSKLYIFPIHSLVVNGATFDLKKWNGTISELHGSFIAASVKLVYFMIGATGGVYNKHTRMFHVPCDGKFPNITLNIGVNGTESVILTSKDYVGYYVGQFTNDDLSRKCYLKFTDAKNDWDQDNQLTLSASFLNNHCFSYNLKTDTIGFADSLPPKVNGHTSDGSADGTELDGNSTGTPNVTTTPDTEFLSDNAFHCKMTNDFMLSIVLCGFVALFV